ncbi:MAG: TetR/AcrR family transcriptional regulator [Symploca sp. SIO1B1]|nr:TetR/AcrR family transcriptional regulator [Symploca sp. SIO1A3]NER95459.1 TetR/AcrR family transcriptional regulator [Symploca sp. SIO1B1]
MGRLPIITNEEILEAAREVFLAQGYTASTLDIAQKAGISEGSIFKRFPTKEKLFLAAMGIPERPEWLAELDLLSGKGNLKENLITLSLQIIEFFREVLPRLVMTCSQGTHHQKMQNFQESPLVLYLKALINFFVQELQQGRIRSCDPEIPARMLFGSLMNYVFFEQVGVQMAMPIATPTYVRGLIDILWQGIALP